MFNFFSSTMTVSAGKLETDDSSSSGSNPSRYNTFLPPIPSMGLNILTPSTSTSTNTYTSASECPLETETSYISSKDLSSDLGGGSSSYQSIYTKPPHVKKPYEPADALLDIPALSYALELFLQSHMLESEEFCNKSDEQKERLYFATGYGLIQCVKGLMSYEDDVSSIRLPIFIFQNFVLLMATYPLQKHKIGPLIWNCAH